MGRFASEKLAAKTVQSFILGFTQIWLYAWGNGTLSHCFGQVTGTPDAWQKPALNGFIRMAFCITAMIGFERYDILSRVAVPAMLIFILISLLHWR